MYRERRFTDLRSPRRLPVVKPLEYYSIFDKSLREFVTTPTAA